MNSDPRAAVLTPPAVTGSIAADAVTVTPFRAPAIAEGPRTSRALVIGCWTGAVLAAMIQAWLSRHAINTDGISYADVGDAFVRGNWSLAINGYWSPLYACVLGLAVAAVKPSMWHELPLYHVVNVLVFIAAMAAFHAFLVQLLRTRAGSRKDRTAAIPDAYVIVLGYLVFTYGMLDLITLKVVNPDVGVTAIVFLAARQLLRIWDRPGEWRPYLLLGLTLGVGYLVKVTVLPVSVVFLLGCLIARAAWRVALPRIAAASLIVAVIALPFAVALSIQKGRPTFGDSARLNYAWYMNLIARYHWQGNQAGSGTPTHTTRLVHADPDVWEFRSPNEATYSPWADPSYWNDGLKARFGVSLQLRRALSNIREIYYIAHHRQTALIVGLLVLLAIGSLPAASRRLVAMLLLPGLAATVMFVVVHLEARFLAGYIVVGWTVVYASLCVSSRAADERWAKAVLMALLVVFSTEVLAAVFGSSPVEPKQEAVAAALASAGVPARTDVAVIWSEDVAKSYAWARLARQHVIAEADIPGCRFWTLPANNQRAVIEALSRTGAAYAVATELDDCVPPAPWQFLRDVRYAVLRLPDSGARRFE